MRHFKTLEYEFHKSPCLGQNTGWHSSLTVNLDFSAGIPGEPVSASAAPAGFHSSQPASITILHSRRICHSEHGPFLSFLLLKEYQEKVGFGGKMCDHLFTVKYTVEQNGHGGKF